MHADLHIHSDCSDGSDSIKELAEKIYKSGLNIVALTDHDTVYGLYEFNCRLPSNVKFINGIELSCRAESMKCHILGYFINPENPALKDLIIEGKELRRQKLETRLNHLKEVWNITLPNDELQKLYEMNSVGKPHIAKILVSMNLAENNDEAINKYLNGCKKSGNDRLDAKKAISVIKQADGIPVWAHPLGGEGEKHISESQFLEQLEYMKEIGIQGLECYYSRYTKEEIEFLVSTAQANGLLISGGSDYHGTNKSIPLGKLNAENEEIDVSKLTILFADKALHMHINRY